MIDGFEITNIESFDYPVLVVDESLFITEKNIAAGEYKVKFRQGASLKKYLSSYDIRRIEELEKGDILFITAIERYEDFFIVYRAQTSYYLIHATMINILNKRLEKYCDETVEVNRYFNFIFENSENNNNTDTKQRKMRFISKLKRHYAVFNELFFGESVFSINDEDIMGIVSYAFDKMLSILNKENKMLFFDNRVKTPLKATFSVDDVALVLSSLVVIACSLKEMGNVSCSTDFFSDELIISVGFIGKECDVYDKMLLSFDEATSNSRNIEMFELLLLKRLCEHNGWKLKFSLFSDKTNQVIRLYIPCNATSLLKMSLDNRNYDFLETLINDELSFII